MLFYWYFILHFNYYTTQQKTTQDSTKSRDRNADQQYLPVTTVPAIDTFVTVRPQITFFQLHYFDEICSTVTYVANAIHPVPTLPSLPVTVLQPLTVYETTVSDDSLSTPSDSTDASVITVQENNPSQEVDSNSLPTSLTPLSDYPISTDNSPTPIQSVEPPPIQPVEPVIGLTTKEQR